MKRIISKLAYLWALLALPIVLAAFIGNSFWAEKLITITGLQISPWDTGGEIVQTINHDTYQTLIHRPVFDGLIAERKKGFVQVDWRAVGGVLPKKINEAIDYDRDGIVDFRIQWDTGRNDAEVIAASPDVIGLGGVYRLESERVVRVLLKNKDK
ncbi:MAG: hypothetical protein ACM3YE_15370 [Bacteroidota bacterium]